MNSKQISVIEEFIQKNNRESKIVQFYPRIEYGQLIEISVRFVAPAERYYSNDIEDMILDRIVSLSSRRLFPSRNGLFKNGVLELKVSDSHRYTRVECIIRSLEFISNEMIDLIINSRKEG